MPQYTLIRENKRMRVEITQHGPKWKWREVDEHGRYSADSQPFDSEEYAKAHAKAVLGGGAWEN